MGNILWRDCEPVAVVDWEMATVGPPEVDIAWMIWLHAFFQNLARQYGLPGMPDFLQRRQVAATYEQISGRPVRDLEWYEAYAMLRMAIIIVRTSMRSVVFGTAQRPDDPNDLINFRGLLEQVMAGTYFD